jgi:hypothetical protein
MFYILLRGVYSSFNRVRDPKVLKLIPSGISIYNLLASFYLFTIKFD